MVMLPRETASLAGGFDTLVVHGGREDFRELVVHAAPIDLSTTYPVPALDEVVADLDAWSGGEQREHDPIYGRVHNPTVARFERALAGLEGTESAVAFSTGMAALTACLLASCRERPHVVALRPLYGTSDHLLASGLLATSVSFVTDVADVVAAITPDTGLIVLETPTNPTLELVDIAELVGQVGQVPLLVDNTFATPLLQQPARFGAAFVLHSATKFLGGHGDVMGGVIATSESRARQLRQVRFATGALLHPLAGYLLHRGLATLGIRVRTAQGSATTLAERLRGHGAIKTVHHPTPDGTQLVGPGAVLAFTLHGGRREADTLLHRLRLITPAVSLGAVDTLIQHPASLTHRIVDQQARGACGVGEDLLRLSVGLEDVEDLWNDLNQALTP